MPGLSEMLLLLLSLWLLSWVCRLAICKYYRTAVILCLLWINLLLSLRRVEMSRFPLW
ncbi:hypothetical protein [Mosinovirus]|nr:hypothetical protein [Mosinovirus]